MRTLLAAAFTLVALTAGAHVPAVAGDARQSMYVNLADSLGGSFDNLTASLRAGFQGGGWDVVAVHDASGGPSCPYHARVFVLNRPAYTATILAHGALAALALPVRVLLYEDEAGKHLAAVNPLSLNRTMVAETGMESASSLVLQDLERLAAAAVHGRFVRRAYGQVRERGLIGRTMGIMAGGPFPEKVKTVWSTPGAGNHDVALVADRVWNGIERAAGGGKWQMHGIYRLDLSEQGVVLLGVSGAAMEAKSFAIVGAAGDARRSHDRCPGIDHAAAYPIEILVYREQGSVRVAVIDGMYRMKVFFEDAGKMKFAANMTMPGSIEDEIRALVLATVAAKP
jgi:uncharacterized protein (DUF302 family)